jgi:acyl-coenzyme A thioesterase PaaI-like protein
VSRLHRVVRKIPRLIKKERQEKLKNMLEQNPFLTDESLANAFGVSVQTIRLDRLELGIPEYRERIKDVAQKNLGQLRALTIDEVIGEIIDLQLDHSAISILEIGEEHVFSKTKIARGHFQFAQANSLAIAVTDGEIVLTAAARVRFIRPVKLGEKLVAKAVVKAIDANGQRKVRVDTRVNDELVFSGVFRVVRFDDEMKRKW